MAEENTENTGTELNETQETPVEDILFDADKQEENVEVAENSGKNDSESKDDEAKAESDESSDDKQQGEKDSEDKAEADSEYSLELLDNTMLKESDLELFQSQAKELGLSKEQAGKMLEAQESVIAGPK